MKKGLSLFANVGIAETYLKDVGVNIVVANELIGERAEFYRHLYPECEMILGDISNKDIFDNVLFKAKKQMVDFILATPPCQGMSIAGHMGPEDERNSLVKYAVDMVLDIKPKFALFENVTQQLTTPIDYHGKSMLIPEYIALRLGENYNINENKIINCADYGVCQMRKRAIFLLARKDTKFQWEFPEPEEKKPILEELFKGVPDLWPIIREKNFKEKIPTNTKEVLSFHKWHRPPIHCWRNVECMLYTPAGNTAFDNPIHYPKKANGKRVKGFDTTYHRQYWEKQAATVTKYNGSIGSQNNVHPGRPWRVDDHGDMMYTNPRVLTIYELLKVSTLPDDWNIPDWAKDELIRHVIGEGVPPMLIKKLMLPIKEMLK